MPLICADCKKPITGAKTVIHEMWHCARCTYIHDYPNKEIVERKRIRARPAQTETLFEPPPKIQKEKRRVSDLD